jgi:hypothetical protein
MMGCSVVSFGTRFRLATSDVPSTGGMIFFAQVRVFTSYRNSRAAALQASATKVSLLFPFTRRCRRIESPLLLGGKLRQLMDGRQIPEHAMVTLVNFRSLHCTEKRQGQSRARKPSQFWSG